MDDRRIALIASWSQRYIDDHRRWLELHGPHWDGWAHTLSPDNRSLLRKTIASHGRVHFYAYMSRGQGGDGTVRYRIGLDDFTYHWPAERPEEDIGVLRASSSRSWLICGGGVGSGTTLARRRRAPPPMRTHRAVDALDDATIRNPTQPRIRPACSSPVIPPTPVTVSIFRY